MGFGQDKIFGWVFGLSCMLWAFIISNIVMWPEVYQLIDPQLFRFISNSYLMFISLGFLSILLAGHCVMVFTDFGFGQLDLSVS